MSYSNPTCRVATKATAKFDATTAGVQTKASTAAATTPPTQTELVAAFGSAATAGAGFTAILNAGGAGTDLSLVVSDGTAWFLAALTLATDPE